MDPTAKNIEYLLDIFNFKDMDDLYRNIPIERIHITNYLKDILMKEGIKNIYDALSIDIADISIRHRLSSMSSEVVDRELFRSFGILNKLDLKSPPIIVDAEVLSNIFNILKNDKVQSPKEAKPRLDKTKKNEILANLMDKNLLYNIGNEYINCDDIINEFISSCMPYSSIFINSIDRDEAKKYILRLFVDFVIEQDIKFTAKNDRWKVDGEDPNDFVSVYIDQIFNTSDKIQRLLLGDNFCDNMVLVDIGKIDSDILEQYNNGKPKKYQKKDYYELFDMIKLKKMFPFEYDIEPYYTLTDFLLGLVNSPNKFTKYRPVQVGHIAKTRANYYVLLLNHMGFYYKKDRWMFNIDQNHQILKNYIYCIEDYKLSPKEEYVKKKVDRCIKVLNEKNNTVVYYFNNYLTELFDFKVSTIIKNKKLLELLRELHISRACYLFNNKHLMDKAEDEDLKGPLLKALARLGIYYKDHEYDLYMGSNEYTNIIHCHLKDLYDEIYHSIT